MTGVDSRSRCTPRTSDGVSHWRALAGLARAGPVRVLWAVIGLVIGCTGYCLVRPEAGLHLAMVTHQPVLVASSVRLGADPNARSRSGSSPLCEAVLTGKIRIARALLVAGADPNAPDQATDSSLRPLRIALIAGDLDMVRLLLEYGADRSLTDAN